jgi:predicted metalloprotease with PDZ domain
VYGTKVPDYNSIFSKVGLNVQYIGVSKPSFGATVAQEGNKTVVRAVRSSSAAEEAGISVNDEIIGCNGFRVDQGAFEGMVGSANVNDVLDILISRDELLVELKVRMTNYERPQYKFVPIDSSATNQLKKYWLRTL